MPIPRRTALFGLALTAATTAAGAGRAAEDRPAEGVKLVMFDSPGCEWCDLWDAEVGVVYDRTPEGRRAPLVRLNKRDDLPAGLSIAGEPHYTPTFVLLNEGREVGRIEGYPGEDFFWGLLARMLETHVAGGAEGGS